MPVEVEPPELARLLDYAERPRVDDWSLRAALCRYASPEPVRVGALIELMRRIEFGLQPHLKDIERNGPDVWAAIEGSADGGGFEVELLRVAQAIDRYGDVLAAWAVDSKGPTPDAETDAIVRHVAVRVEELKVPREEWERGPDGRPRRRRPAD